MTKIRDRFTHPGPQPNGLQASENGLWVIDQTDNHIYQLRWEDGSVIKRLPAEVAHSSGITLGPENIWISSTYGVDTAGDAGNPKIVKCDMNGNTLARYETPGASFNPIADQITGAHGLEWVDEENMWIAVPPSETIYLVDPRSMEVKHSIPSPGDRPHGIFQHGGYLWLGDTTLCIIHKIEPKTGQILDEINLPEPEIHGVTVHNDKIWFCCAETGRYCTVDLPI